MSDLKSNILKRPILNEKFAALNEKGVYGFVVDTRANKIEIRQSIEQLYGVTVNVVRTMNVLGKPKSRMQKGRVMSGRTQNYKKAIVTLAEGETIDFFSNNG